VHLSKCVSNCCTPLLTVARDGGVIRAGAARPRRAGGSLRGDEFALGTSLHDREGRSFFGWRRVGLQYMMANHDAFSRLLLLLFQLLKVKRNGTQNSATLVVQCVRSLLRTSPARSRPRGVAGDGEGRLHGGRCYRPRFLLSMCAFFLNVRHAGMGLM
jgi:hypothetical protein